MHNAAATARDSGRFIHHTQLKGIRGRRKEAEAVGERQVVVGRGTNNQTTVPLVVDPRRDPHSKPNKRVMIYWSAASDTYLCMPSSFGRNGWDLLPHVRKATPSPFQNFACDSE